MNKKMLVNIFVCVAGILLIGAYFVEHRWLELSGSFLLIIGVLVVNNHSNE